METTAFITLDLQRLTYNRIRAKQNDTWRRRVNITVLSDGLPLKVAESSEFVVQYRKPDGTKGFYTHLPDGTVACTSSLNDIYMTMAPQMLTVAGEVSCSIAMLDQDHQILQTFSFFVDVEESENAGATSDDYLNAPTLQNLVNLTQDVLNKLGDISELKTSDKTSSVAAINELFTLFGSSQSSISESIESLKNEVHKRVRRVNGIPPNVTGVVNIRGKDIPSFPANIPDFEGSVDDALDRLATEVFSPDLSGWRSALENYSAEDDVVGLPILDTADKKYGKMVITETDDEMNGEQNFFEVPTVATAKAMIREAIRLGYIDVTQEYEAALESGAVGSAREYLWTLGAGRWFLVVRDANGDELEKFYLNAVSGEESSVIPNGLVFRFLVHSQDYFYIELHNDDKYNAVPAIMLDGETGKIYSYGKEIGNGGNGTAGAVGYYLPRVKQTEPGAVSFSFEPSEDGMPPVATRTVSLPKGDKGDPGEDGNDGYTPVAGVDYYTDADKAEFQAYLATELAKRGQLKPEFANSVEECTDTSKLYVLPDGMIYAYILTTVEPVNQIPISTDTDRVTVYSGGDGSNGYAAGIRLSSDGSTKTTTTAACTTGFIPVTPGQKLKVIDIDHITGVAEYIIAYDSSNKATGNIQINTSSGGGSLGIWDSQVTKDTSFELVLTEALLGANFNAIRLCTVIDNNSIVYIEDPSSSGMSYKWASTGHAFVPADYESRIIALEEQSAQNKAEIEALKSSNKSKGIMFVSPDGDDNNDGLTENAPKRTVASCVSAGATRIAAKRGVYREQVSISNIDSLEIFPSDNDQDYSTDADWHPIVFDLSDTIAVGSLQAYNAIKRVQYSNTENEQFDKVFVAKSQPAIIGDGYGSRYNATVWLMSNDETMVCVKLKPVLTIAEVEAEANTFCFVDGYIYINADMTGVEKICIPTNWDSGFRVSGANRITLREVEVRFSGSYNIWLLDCPIFDFYKVSAKYSSYGSGIDIDNANGTLTACYATKNYDGFGISGYGHTTYIDCVSEFNFDDGVSHHNGSEGTFIGGRYEGNGKGGNTPAYGARVNIYGGIYKDNSAFGIGYLYTPGKNPASGVVQNATIVGNAIGLKVGDNCTVTEVTCLYSNNTTKKEVSGNLTEYS